MRRRPARKPWNSSRRRFGRWSSSDAFAAMDRKSKKEVYGSTRSRRFAKAAIRDRSSNPANRKESTLIEAVRYAGDVQMPPKRKLDDDEIAALVKWVKIGVALVRYGRVLEAGRRFCRRRRSLPNNGRFGRSGRSETPSRRSVRDAAWPTSPIDRFILADSRPTACAVADGRQE